MLQWAAVALLAALVLPLLLPPGRLHRGNAVRVLLALAAGLALAGALTPDAGLPGRILRLGALLLLVCGVIGVVGVLLFDLVLPAVGAGVPSILRDVVLLAVAALAMTACLRLAGVDVLPILTTSAVLTAVVGLALQPTIANVFGGLSLQLDRTLGEGDWVETGGRSGRIVEIGWRSTRLVTRDGDTLFLPNSQLLSGEVLNLSQPTAAHRTIVEARVHVSHAPGTVRTLLVEAARDVPGVLAYPPPDCIVQQLGDPTITYAIRFWLGEFEREPAITGEVRARIWYAIRRAGLSAPPSELRVAPIAEKPRATPETVLRASELLAPLDDDARAELAQRMRRLDFTAGEAIFHQGASGDSLYVIERGEVGVRVAIDGSSAEVATLGAGEVFGEMSLLTGEPRTATCTARTEVRCWVVERAAFETLLAERPQLLEPLSATLAARQAALEAQRTGLSSGTRVRIESEQRSRLLGRMRELFGIGGREA